MIIICEPQCKGFSHEKFNSGFIYGLSLAFPGEKIVFFSHSSHIQAIQRILVHDKVSISDIEYVSIRYGNPFSLLGLLTYSKVLKNIFEFAVKNSCSKLFFLSYSPLILYVIKKLKEKHSFSRLKFTLVLHGGFESIAGNDTGASGIVLQERKVKDIPFYKKLFHLNFEILVRKFLSKFTEMILFPVYKISSILFEEKRMLLWRHSSDFKYVALSPHVRVNAEKYMDVDFLNINTVILPTVFEEISPQPQNDHVKFAVFGYGDSLMLYNIALLLSKRGIKAPYEVRIIGMDNRGVSSFPNFTCPSPGKGLDRSEMKAYAEDIDVFLLLYDKNRYRLSCSGSILESLSYCKPIIHFNNDCIDSFNTLEHPIGIRCSSLDDYVSRMQDIIENYKLHKEELGRYRGNIVALRSKVSIERSVNDLRRSFEW